MKYAGIIVAAYLLLPMFSIAQGGGCNSPYVLQLDAVCRNYSTSSSTGSTSLCTTNTSLYGGTGQITVFSFTTNASGSCVLINLTTSSPNQAAEVLLYTTCNGGGAGNLQNQQTTSGMCFDTGDGIWAPAETLTLSANTTYYLRVWTKNAGTITMCAKSYTPPNNTCAGATAIGPTPITDNNACNKPGTGVTPGQLCALSLENTAFYTYTVQTTGTSSIDITSISCNNGDNNSQNYMQVGFFTGNCSALNWVSCTTTSGANVTATTNSLTAGTKVYVAIDGYAGSNCKFSISATNAVALAASIKYFSGWKNSTSNILRWVSLQEFNNDYYEVERSENGRDFTSIGRLPGELSSYTEKTYQLEDKQPPARCFYRLKQVDIDGNARYYKTIEVTRSELPYILLSFENPVINNSFLNLQTNFRGPADLTIVNMSGIIVRSEKVGLNKGENILFRNFSTLPPGKYIISVAGEQAMVNKVFIKVNSTLSYK